MAFEIETNDAATEEVIDVTPMISVLLVLIIFFILAQEGMQKGLNTQLPPIQKHQVQPQQPNKKNHQLVLQVMPGQTTYLLNKHPIPAGQLEQRLHKVFAPRIRKVLFVKGSENVSYGQVIYAVDAAHAAGVSIVGLVPRQLNSSNNNSAGGK